MEKCIEQRGHIWNEHSLCKFCNIEAPRPRLIIEALPMSNINRMPSPVHIQCAYEDYLRNNSRIGVTSGIACGWKWWVEDPSNGQVS